MAELLRVIVPSAVVHAEDDVPVSSLRHVGLQVGAGERNWQNRTQDERTAEE
ncbi:hypothetical protein [Scytonema millei]|uniref:hypothetical protein n=1 Tax=Scytonema millei TaxID=1245922 RepID=UPI002573094D|nr:hypothetical protein [Scytonema millei]